MAKPERSEAGNGSYKMRHEGEEKSMIHFTYMIYIIFWESLTIGGCAYLIFFKGYSGWWFILAILLSTLAYSPEKWNVLFNKKD